MIFGGSFFCEANREIPLNSCDCGSESACDLSDFYGFLRLSLRISGTRKWPIPPVGGYSVGVKFSFNISVGSSKKRTLFLAFERRFARSASWIRIELRPSEFAFFSGSASSITSTGFGIWVIWEAENIFWEPIELLDASIWNLKSQMSFSIITFCGNWNMNSNLTPSSESSVWWVMWLPLYTKLSLHQFPIKPYKIHFFSKTQILY